jgi:hypothetical protein
MRVYLTVDSKGRVERLFGTLQDRLVKELRRAGATNLAEANAVLVAYLPRFNQRFMQEAAEPGSAYQPCLTRAEANERICFTYTRTVTNDHTISLFGQTVALPALPGGLNLARRRVDLHHRMDGRLAVVYQGQRVGLIQPAVLGPPRLEAFVPAAQHLPTPRPSQPPQPPAPAAPAAQRKPPKPAADHPWRRPYDPQLCAKKQQQQQQPKQEKEPG